MIAIELSFPSGRYHATAWGHHVNEGVVEWPPSPWRILRALVAVRHSKGAEEVDEAQLSRLVEALASDVPRYRIPRSTGAHTRHYMPLYKDSTTKVFDTFLHVQEGGTLQAVWPDAELGEGDRKALASLLEKMAYLGRAESWTEARLMDTREAVASGNVEPLDGSSDVAGGLEIVRLLAPLPARELATWRARALEQELERVLESKRERAEQKGKDAGKVELSASDRKKVDGMLPKSVLEALQVETGALRKQGWSAVPGARWIEYGRPRRSMTGAPTRRRAGVRKLPTVARFAVASQVPPRLTDVVSMADRVRRALMSRSDAHPVFSGKDEAGQPLRGHRHAFILPEANGAHGRISHVTLFAPMGFDTRARAAMDGLTGVWGRGGHDVQLVLLGLGEPVDFAGERIEAGQCALLVESREWISRTPFVATRHAKLKRSGEGKRDEAGLIVGSPEHDLRRLMCEAGLPAPARVEPLEDTRLGGKSVRWLEFHVERAGGGRRAGRRGHGYRIELAEPVRGPIALGYGAHFGLGMFVPATRGRDGK